MDALNDPKIQEIVGMTSAQVGKTTILENITAYHIDQDPSPMLMVQPTLEMGEAFSKDRLAPMLRDTPTLRGKVKDARSRDSGNTLLHKVFPGGHITIAGANSPASLASRPIRIVLCDEVDRYPMSAGTEGDPVSLARKRTMTFWNRKIVLMSTPTIAGRSRIEKAYKDSDQRKYFVPCLDCGEPQILEWSQVKWAGDSRSARYECKSCRSQWDDPKRWRAIRAGSWQATAPFSGVAGFWINVLYSPWVKLSEVASEFLLVKDHPEQLKVWVNTALGETWQERGDAPEWRRIYDRREAWEYGKVPRGALFLTLFCDVQADRLECEVKGWGRGGESWSIWYEVIKPNRPTADGRSAPTTSRDPEQWNRLAEIILQEWEHVDGGKMPIWCAGIDTGFNAEIVYQFCRQWSQPAYGPSGAAVPSFRTVAPTKGGTSAIKLIEHISDTDAARKRAGLKIVTIGTHGAKQELYDSLRLEPTVEGKFPPRYCHFPMAYDVSYFQGLTAETRLVKQSGAIEWRNTGRNEPLDCAVGNRAMAELCGISRFSEDAWGEMEARLVQSAHPMVLPAAQYARRVRFQMGG